MHCPKHLQRQLQPSTTSSNSAVHVDNGQWQHLLSREGLMGTRACDVQEVPWMFNKIGSKTFSAVHNDIGRDELQPGEGLMHTNGLDLRVKPSIFKNNGSTISLNQQISNVSHDGKTNDVMDNVYNRTPTTLSIDQPLINESESCFGMEISKGSLKNICRREQAERISVELSVCSDDENLDQIHVPSFKSSMSVGEVTRRIRAINWDLDDGTMTKENVVRLERHVPLAASSSSEVDSVTFGAEVDQVTFGAKVDPDTGIVELDPNSDTNQNWIRLFLQYFKISCFN